VSEIHKGARRRLDGTLKDPGLGGNDAGDLREGNRLPDVLATAYVPSEAFHSYAETSRRRRTLSEHLEVPPVDLRHLAGGEHPGDDPLVLICTLDGPLTKAVTLLLGNVG